MKIRPLFLHIDDIKSRKIIYAPRGTLYDKVIMCWEDNDRPFPWWANKRYDFDYDGTYTLGEHPEGSGNYIMLWKPEIVINEKQHIKDKDIEIIIPSTEGEGRPDDPILEKTITLDPEEEKEEVEEENPETGEIETIEKWDGTIGFGIVKMTAKYNEEEFPVNWGQEAREVDRHLISTGNIINYNKHWRKLSLKAGLVDEYYCGIDLRITIVVDIGKINNLPISNLIKNPGGKITIYPNETITWIEKHENETGNKQYKITSYHRGTNEKTPETKQTNEGYILEKRNLWPDKEKKEKFNLCVSNWGDKHLIKIEGSEENISQELALMLDRDLFGIQLNWE